MTLAIAIFFFISLCLVLWAFLAAPAGTSLREVAKRNLASVSNKAVNIWLALIVLFFFAAALIYAVHSTYFILAGEKTQGLIVGLEKKAGKSALYPIFTYSDQYRTERTATSQYSNGAYDIGEAVPVRYLPGDPPKSRIDDFKSNWANPLVFLLAGLLMLGYLQGYSWMKKRKIRSL